MNAESAKLFLQNLLDRLEKNPATGQMHLDGVVSGNEIEAVRYALRLLGAEQAAPDDAPQGAVSATGTGDGVSGTQASGLRRRIQLCLSSLERREPDDSGIILCLDFGTAMSKAAATDGDDRELILLRIGEMAGEPGKLFSVSSTLYISHRDTIYFGHEAFETSLNEYEEGRERFDSPKQYMSQGDFETLETRVVNTAINPSAARFTEADLITLYLAF